MARRMNARERRERRNGLALIAGAALAFAGLLGGAWHVDNARGISAAQSLDQWGL